MRFTVRTKLLVLVNLAVVTIIALVLLSHWLSERHRQEIETVRGRLVPRIELALQFESKFGKLNRALQDAAQAQDMDTLDDAGRIRDEMLKLLDVASPALDRRTESDLRMRLEEYFETGRTVSKLLIEGKTGDAAASFSALQKRQRALEDAIHRSTSSDRAELDRAFSELLRGNARTGRIRVLIGVAGLFLVLALGYWLTRRILGGLQVVSDGLSRFSTGDFVTLIPQISDDELGDLARDANAMASKLSALGAQRDRADWIKSGQIELARELAGAPNVNELATKVASALVRRLDALAVAIYLLSDDGVLRLAGHCCCIPQDLPSSEAHWPAPTMTAGVGLLGGAIDEDRLVMRRDLPPHYFRILSGLGQGYASALTFLPLRSRGERIGVIELASVGELPEASQDFLNAMQDSLFVTFAAAQARAAVDELLDETRTQAQRLAQQEEELRVTNQELLAQQEELQRANHELEEQQQALSERNQELDVARQRVQEKMQELSRVSLYKSQFLANMSHELRTPLNSMLLLSHLLAQNDAKNLTDKQVQHCRTIHAAGEDLLDLINQVLDLSKIEAGKQEIRLEHVQVHTIAETMQRMYEPLAKEKQLDFTAQVAPETPATIATDRLRLERILTNLIGNAIKFTETGGVTLSIQPLEAKILFQVRDTGIGIPAEQQGRAFLPFEQLEATSSRRYQGSGLGLAIVAESVKLLGGEITLESEVGKGSTFKCVFPLQVEARESAVVDTAPPAVTGPQNQQVLIIEDDDIVAEQLAALVRGRSLVPVLAKSGEEGLRLAKLNHPRGIILDIKLPDTDGWTVIDRLKADQATRGIPVHFLSALDAPFGDLTRGAVGYLTKPATSQELIELIHKLAPPTTSMSQRVMVVEDSAAEGKSIVALLESEHFEAVHVSSAETALDTLARSEFGCIILDLTLANMDGLAFLEALRARPDLGPYGIIVHTGRSLSKEEINLLQANAQAIVLKDGNSSTRLLEEVRLFVHHVKEGVSSNVESPSASFTEDSKALQGTCVLLAEDDMRTVYSLSALLQSRGCEVLVAENGREALDLLAQHDRIKCLITDIMMPQMDGYEAMAHIRAEERFRDLPIIALTARAMPGERERCLSKGANAYLTKPVDGQGLITTLVDLLGVPHAS